MRTRYLFLCGYLIATAAQAALPEDGRLDPNFGTAGKTRIAINDGTWNADVASGMAVGADAVYVIGRIMQQNGEVSTITKLDRNGLVNKAFGNSGTLLVTMFNGVYNNVAVRAGAVQPDGKLIVVGNASAISSPDMLVCRFLPTGEVDAVFGAQGCQTLRFAIDDTSYSSYSNDVIIQPDGKILVVGTMFLNSLRYIAAARLTTSGTPDATFGTNGKWFYPSTGSEGRKIALDNNGRIVVAGEYKGGTCSSFDPTGRANAIEVIKLLANGQSDPVFNGGAVLTFSFDYGYDSINDIVVDCSISEEYVIGIGVENNGAIYLAARAEQGSDGDFVATITKISPNGTFDTKFGQPTGEGAAVGQRAVAVSSCQFCSSNTFTSFQRLSDGRMLLAGETRMPGAPHDTIDTLVMRLDASGMVDTTFGQGLFGESGRAVVDFATTSDGSNDHAVALGLQDGQPMIAGWTLPFASTDADLTVFRLRDDRIFWHQFEN